MKYSCNRSNAEKKKSKIVCVTAKSTSDTLLRILGNSLLELLLHVIFFVYFFSSSVGICDFDNLLQRLVVHVSFKLRKI